MSVLNWLKKSNPNLKKKFPESAPGLPNPNEKDSLDKAQACAAANSFIESEVEVLTPEGVSPSGKRKRSDYHNYDSDERLQIAKYANINGATAAAIKFSTPSRKINESTVRNWVKKFRKIMNEESASPREVEAKQMDLQPRGAPPLLGKKLDQEVQDHIRDIRAAGGVINRKITIIATAMGIVSYRNRSLLSTYGGSIELTRTWAESIIHRMGYVKRKGTKAARKVPENLPELKENFLKTFSDKVVKYKIPDELILNFDQTGVSIVPVSNWTLESEGSQQVEITGLEDKRQVTVLLAETLAGDLLPPQVIYEGKTNQCHPRFTFPLDWNITHTESHWSNEVSMKEYFKKVIRTYVEDQRDQLGLPLKQKALAIFDVYAPHPQAEFIDSLKDAGVECVFVPGGCTSELQPLDISGNKVFKDEISHQFTTWYAEKISASLKSGSKPEKVDLKLSTLKPIHARWLLAAYDKFKSSPKAIQTGWDKSGITSAVSDARDLAA